MSDLLIYGKGGHSRVVGDIAILLGYQPIYLDDNDPLENLPNQFIVAIGDNQIRKKRFLKLQELGLFPVNIFHSSFSYISSTVYMGLGIFIGPGVVINTLSSIGHGCIINTKVSIDHDCNVGSFTHIAPGVSCCGGVSIGENTLIGVGTSIIPNIQIGNNVIVAGGSSVKQNIATNTFWAGNPAIKKKDLLP